MDFLSLLSPDFCSDYSVYIKVCILKLLLKICFLPYLNHFISVLIHMAKKLYYTTVFKYQRCTHY